MKLNRRVIISAVIALAAAAAAAILTFSGGSISEIRGDYTFTATKP